MLFLKIMFFLRIFEQYGFLVAMVFLTLLDLIPFIAGFIISIVFFALCFHVLGADVDDEIAEV